MEKIECFEIENIKLFLKDNLIEIDYVPVFYTCEDNSETIYIVICTNICEDESEIITSDNYIIIKSDNVTVQDMINKKITIRKAVTSGSKFWKVETSDRIKDDKVEKIELAHLTENDCLPDKNAYYTKQWR